MTGSTAPGEGVGWWLPHWAVHRADHPAVLFDDVAISYAELDRRVGSSSRRLEALGVRPGDRVAWLGDNHPAFLVDFLACARIGAIFVPLNTRLSVAEHRYQLDHCEPVLLLARDAYTVQAREAGTGADLAPVDELLDATTDAAAQCQGDGPEPGGVVAAGGDDPALLVYTSGTTGAPKGALHTHAALTATIENGVAAQDLTADDVGLGFLPLFHVGGLNIQVLPLLSVGATVVLLERFEPGGVLADITRHRPTVGLFVPTTMQAVLDHPDWSSTDLSCFRGVIAGSSVVPESLLRRFLEAGVRPGQIYGSTETGPTSLVLGFDEADRVGSCGRSALHAEVKLGPGNEVLVAGPHLFSGYWADERATAEAFSGRWYHTGDVGHCDGEWFTIDDRLDDLIISGGENVHPVEVEDVLATAPGVAEIAVIGRSDERWGSVPVAFVVARDGETPPDVEALRDHATGRLARFKVPHDVIVVDSLPRTALGKVKKHDLRAMVPQRGGHRR